MKLSIVTGSFMLVQHSFQAISLPTLTSILGLFAILDFNFVPIPLWISHSLYLYMMYQLG